LTYLYQSNFSSSILDNSSFYNSSSSYADVTQAIFSYTDLYGAKITNEQLDTLQSLHDTTLPDGSTVVI
jgi:uncharacterized protein YjbI with pentapeptide repeats